MLFSHSHSECAPWISSFSLPSHRRESFTFRSRCEIYEKQWSVKRTTTRISWLSVHTIAIRYAFDLCLSTAKSQCLFFMRTNTWTGNLSLDLPLCWFDSHLCSNFALPIPLCYEWCSLDFNDATSKLISNFQTHLDKFDWQMKVFSKKLQDIAVSTRSYPVEWHVIVFFAFFLE